MVVRNLHMAPRAGTVPVTSPSSAMHCRRLLLTATLLLGACGEPQVEQVPDAGSGTETDAGQEPSCPVGTHAIDGGCDATLSWSAGPKLPFGRDHHGTVITEGTERRYLYVLGGTPNRQDSLDSVYRAPLGETGSLGEWEEGDGLPRRISGHTTNLIDGWLVLTSGAEVAPALSPRTHVAKIESNGRIGKWTEGPQLPGGRFHHASAVKGRTLFISGGMHVTGANGDNASDVFAADLGETGELGAWRTLRPLPAKRSHHASFVHEDWLYVLGGLRGNPAGTHEVLTDVLRARIEADGSLGEWTKLSDLPKPLSTHAVLIHAGHLWVIGGIEDGHHFTDSVRRAKLLEDGGLGPWLSAAPLPVRRGHVHHTPIFKDRIYSVAGSTDMNKAVTDVSIGRFE